MYILSSGKEGQGQIFLFDKKYAVFFIAKGQCFYPFALVETEKM